MKIRIPHRVRRALAAGVTIVMGIVSCVTLAAAQNSSTNYVDVEAGAWYEPAADALLKSGALDSSESRLRPSALATRAEVMKLLVRVADRQLLHPAVPSFNDVPKTTWYYPYVETAADAGWVRGDNDCYQNTRPCTARPGDGVNRAEMAALLQRAFALSYEGTAPQFPDVRRGEWYFTPVQAAADHCILQGDDRTGNVRPSAFMNRAEMIVMFHRASENQQYGEDCGVMPQADIQSIDVLSDRRLQVTFSESVDARFADDASRYTLARASGGGAIDVEVAAVLNVRTVELTVDVAMSESTTYRLSANDLRTSGGETFSDSMAFTFQTVSPAISDVTVLSSRRIAVTFTESVDASVADDPSRYGIERVGGGGSIDVDSAIVMNAREVELTLEASMTQNATYRLMVENIRTVDGDTFDDIATFTFGTVSPGIIDVSVRSSDMVRVRFSNDLLSSRADDAFRYTVARSSGGGSIDVERAVVVDSRTVDLDLESSLSSNSTYILSIEDLLTIDDMEFNDTVTFRTTESEGDLLSASAVSATRVQLTFNVPVDEFVAEDRVNYRITSADSTLAIGSATRINDTTVDLVLNESLQTQQLYTVSVNDLETEDGDTFSDAASFVYGPSNVSFAASIAGIREVPPVVSAATGTGTFILTATGLQYDITVRNLSGSQISGAHFHLGATGTEGNVVETINFNAGTRATGTWTDLTAIERDALLDGGIYVNIHTPTYPDGEIRGQVIRQ